MTEVVTLLDVFEGRFSKTRLFVDGGTSRKSRPDKPNTFHIEVRTLSATRMFSEKHVFSRPRNLADSRFARSSHPILAFY